ncbi:MAG: chemotaxis protein CheA [Acidobacteria bacterium]|nr:chemotaxis protein CheA [Acidobacteriota bacterium]
MSQFSDDPAAELRDLFFETAGELLQALNEDALKLEKAPADEDVIRSMRRTVHTLKGDAAAAGFQQLSELAHVLEDALAIEARAENPSLAELGFVAADTFASMLAAYRAETALPDTSAVRRLVQDLASQPQPGSVPTAKSISSGGQAKWTEYEKLSAETAASQGKKILHVVAQLDPLCAMPIAARQLLVNALSGLAEILAARPEPGSAVQGQAIELLVATSEPESAIAAKCRIPTVITTVECFEPARGNAPIMAPADGQAAATARPGPRSTAAAIGAASPVRRAAGGETILRVDAERIDNVLNLIGEMIIGKSMLQQALEEYTSRFSRDPLRSRLQDAMAMQARVLNDLQRSVMKIRMVPVEQLFRRFPRMVRDLGQRCNKSVELIVRGENTDVDKSLLDAIAEPLTHIVRNAISHGLESAEERTRAGKPAAGRIHLDASHQANQLIVEVTDDGRGIDVRKVKARAIESGLVRADEVERLSNAQVLDLIFRPGFSTADEITEVSGRGVGLDVVGSVLHRLKGSVEVETRPGQGTKFRLKLPLTLAITKALLFRIAQRLYAIPLNTVIEIARARESELHRVDRWEVVELRGQVLPLIRLEERSGEEIATSDRRIFVLVIQPAERKIGLIVDAIEGEEELVLKPLDDEALDTDLVTGASVLGDGRVVLILNQAALLERFLASPADSPSTGAIMAAVAGRGSGVASGVGQ